MFIITVITTAITDVMGPSGFRARMEGTAWISLSAAPGLPLALFSHS